MLNSNWNKALKMLKTFLSKIAFFDSLNCINLNTISHSYVLIK